MKIRVGSELSRSFLEFLSGLGTYPILHNADLPVVTLSSEPEAVARTAFIFFMCSIIKIALSGVGHIAEV